MNFWTQFLFLQLKRRTPDVILSFTNDVSSTPLLIFLSAFDSARSESSNGMSEISSPLSSSYKASVFFAVIIYIKYYKVTYCIFDQKSFYNEVLNLFYSIGNHVQFPPWNQSILRSGGNVSHSKKQWELLMGFELTTDR